MGKASSAKRVARVAQSSSRSTFRGSQNIGFYAVVAAVIILGTVLIAYGRNTGSATAATPPVVFKDHWHAAYGVYVCDKFLPAFTNQNETVDGQQAGVHTHGDGVIHVHPFVSSASGRNAKLKVFFKAVGVKYSNTKFELPEGGGTFANGDKCGDTTASWKLLVWDDANSTAKPKVYVTDFANVRFTNDRMAMTLAFVTDKTDVSTLKPTSIPQLDKLGDTGAQPQPGDSTSTTATATGSTVAGSASTVAGSTPTTTGSSDTSAAGTSTTLG